MYCIRNVQYLLTYYNLKFSTCNISVCRRPTRNRSELASGYQLWGIYSRNDKTTCHLNYSLALSDQSQLGWQIHALLEGYCAARITHWPDTNRFSSTVTCGRDIAMGGLEDYMGSYY